MDPKNDYSESSQHTNPREKWGISQHRTNYQILKQHYLALRQQLTNHQDQKLTAGTNQRPSAVNQRTLKTKHEISGTEKNVIDSDIEEESEESDDLSEGCVENKNRRHYRTRHKYCHTSDEDNSDDQKLHQLQERSQRLQLQYNSCKIELQYQQQTARQQLKEQQTQHINHINRLTAELAQLRQQQTAENIRSCEQLTAARHENQSLTRQLNLANTKLKQLQLISAPYQSTKLTYRANDRKTQQQDQGDPQEKGVEEQQSTSAKNTVCDVNCNKRLQQTQSACDHLRAANAALRHKCQRLETVVVENNNNLQQQLRTCSELKLKLEDCRQLSQQSITELQIENERQAGEAERERMKLQLDCQHLQEQLHRTRQESQQKTAELRHVTRETDLRVNDIQQLQTRKQRHLAEKLQQLDDTINAAEYKLVLINEERRTQRQLQQRHLLDVFGNNRLRGSYEKESFSGSSMEGDDDTTDSRNVFQATLI